jgi:hypothetical protein
MTIDLALWRRLGSKKGGSLRRSWKLHFFVSHWIIVLTALLVSLTASIWLVAAFLGLCR